MHLPNPLKRALLAALALATSTAIAYGQLNRGPTTFTCSPIHITRGY